MRATGGPHNKTKQQGHESHRWSSATTFNTIGLGPNLVDYNTQETVFDHMGCITNDSSVMTFLAQMPLASDVKPNIVRATGGPHGSQRVKCQKPTLDLKKPLSSSSCDLLKLLRKPIASVLKEEFPKKFTEEEAASSILRGLDMPVAERESYPSSLPYSDSDPEAATAADTEVTSTTIIILHSHCHQHSRLLCGVVLPWCVMAVVLSCPFVVFLASLAGLVLWCTPLPSEYQPRSRLKFYNSVQVREMLHSVLPLNLGTVSRPRDVFLFRQECGVASEAPMKPALTAKVIPTSDHVPDRSTCLTTENMNHLGHDLRSEMALAINAGLLMPL
ncbi:hypothetical protein J6590_082766 [Homalodisca vitripennis]|nr:hypothetical protein J6590_082766 [Homalodisca vitripennis]